MEVLSIDDLAKKIEFIHKNMQSTRIYWNMKSMLFDQLRDSRKDIPQLENEMMDLINKNRIEEKLKNLINDVCKRNIKPPPIKTDKNEFINEARAAWAESTMQNLIQISNKLLINMASNNGAKSNSTGGDTEQTVNNMYIYDWGNLFNACINTYNYSKKDMNPGLAGSGIISGGLKTLIKCKFDHVNLDDMRKNYEDLSPKIKNLLNTEEEYDFIIEREKQGEYLIEKGMTTELELFARRGVPIGIKTRFYQKYFGISVATTTSSSNSATHAKLNELSRHYKSIQEQMSNHKIILDELIKEDNKEVLNDDRYFIFDEMVDKVLWTFFRDNTVYDNLAIVPILPLNPLEETNKIIPLSGIIPCRGFARYVVPFCYSSEKVIYRFKEMHEDVYGLFREFYCKYFCFLQSISSHSNSILRLCYLFENLLIQIDPNLFKYCTNIGAHPLKIVFPWLMYCFIGYLDTDQIFALFDRVIGFNSLEIIAILAVGIFISKSESLLKCKSLTQVEELFPNLYDVRVVECIRNLLW